LVTLDSTIERIDGLSRRPNTPKEKHDQARVRDRGSENANCPGRGKKERDVSLEKRNGVEIKLGQKHRGLKI